MDPTIKAIIYWKLIEGGIGLGLGLIVFLLIVFLILILISLMKKIK